MSRASRPGARDGATPGRIPLPLFLAIAFLSTVAPVTTDLYLPSFPQLAADFGVDETGAQLTLTASLLGIGVGQLILGPASDRFGRRRPLIVGAAICCVAGAVAVFSPTLPVLIAARFVQGATGAAGMVIGRAVIADIATGATAARAFSLVMTIGGIAPIVGPVVGGFIAGPLGWRGALVIVFALTVGMLVIAVVAIPETHPAERREHFRRRAAEDGSALRDLRSRLFVGNALICAFAFAGLMAYVSTAPFLYQDVIGLDPAQFGLAFGANSLALVAATFLSSRLALSWAPRRILTLGLIVMAAAVASFALVVLTGMPPGLMALCLPVFLGGFGLAQGNAVAAAITAVPRAAGTASAVIGFSQFALAGISTATVGAGSVSLPMSLTIAFGLCLTMLFAGFAVSHRPERGSS
ncbi:multidrug effflux MFS transporter [Herbiconiux sp.]|uniref:multidrug effflux MFS transporter n=1 Tax=Herbiconiux sp. TaxID=1871186 RepID=UPI0025BC0226|nr:multidrug effflux MFS transporter [Herbiconiux sp.]